MTGGLDPFSVALRPLLDAPCGDDPSSIIAALHDAGLTDGLPVIPPSTAAIERLLGGRNPLAPAITQPLPIAFVVPTWWDLAAVAVMAGCPMRPALLDVVAAALDACADPLFNLLGVQTTTGAASPLVIVHAAAGDGFNAGAATMGPGGPVNAPVGRAVRLALQNIGCARSGEADMATLGHPGKLSWLVVENQSASPWAPFAGVGSPGPVNRPSVTVFPGVGNVEIVLPTTTPEAVADRLAGVLFGLAVPDAIVLVPPDAAVFLDRHGWSRDTLVGAVAERGGGHPLVVVTGGTGIKAAVVPRWGGPCAAVTRCIDPAETRGS